MVDGFVDGFLVDDLDSDELTVTAFCRIGNGLVILTILEVELLHMILHVMFLLLIQDFLASLIDGDDFIFGNLGQTKVSYLLFVQIIQAKLSKVSKVAGECSVQIFGILLLVL